MPRYSRRSTDRRRPRRPQLRLILRSAFRPFKWKWLTYVALAGAVLYGGCSLIRSGSDRNIRICLVTDASFRMRNPDPGERLIARFVEINSAFKGTGVQWVPSYGGEAYPSGTQGNLETRRNQLAERGACRADVILGFTGMADPDSGASVAPFHHTALLAETDDTPQALKLIATAHALATLFGIPVDGRAVVNTAAPGEGFLDAPTRTLIRNMRGYDFARGVDALPGRWDKLALTHVTEALAGSAPHPLAEAHRVLARAYAAGRKFPESIAHMRAAVANDPQNPHLRMELALSHANGSDLESAVAELQAAANLDPSDARPHGLLGGIYMSQLRSYDAISELRLATKLSPAEPAYLAALSRALNMQVGHAAEANAALTAALRINPRDRQAAEELEALGDAQRIADAELAKARQAAGQNSGSADAHLQLGYAAVRAGRTDVARTAFEQTIRLQPSLGLAHLALSRLAFDRGDYRGAEQLLAAARKTGVRIPTGFADALGRKLGPSKP